MTSQSLNQLNLPPVFEPYREKLEATVKPYIQIQTHLTQTATLWQSKFLGRPYLPKSISPPKTPEGNCLYLLAQINFAEVRNLEGFPSQGILQFYVAKDKFYFYGADFDNPTAQTHFRVLYHPTPEPDMSKLVTHFDFMPSPWNDDDGYMPFEIHSRYLNKPDSCLALTFQQKAAPISLCDYQYEALIGRELMAQWESDESAASDELRHYSQQFEGHKLGGYPLFTQSDPRNHLPQDQEPYELLLQIDSEDNGKIDILWGDVGICNFFIKPSALEKLDFSDVLYNWDCC